MAIYTIFKDWLAMGYFPVGSFTPKSLGNFGEFLKFSPEALLSFLSIY